MSPDVIPVRSSSDMTYDDLNPSKNGRKQRYLTTSTKFARFNQSAKLVDYVARDDHESSTKGFSNEQKN